jgi:hypothetical protein
MAEMPVMLASLVNAYNPHRMYYDPDGYFAAQEALYVGFAHALLHPEKVGAALINWDEMTEDPARWAGEMLPDILAIGAAAHGAGLFRRAESLEQVTSAGKGVEAVKAAHGGKFEFPKVSSNLAREKLAGLGFDPASEPGLAARGQLGPPFTGVDRWQAMRLRHGQLIAVVDGWKTAMPFEGDLTMDGAKFHRDLQMYATRHVTDGMPGAPQVEAAVKIYRVAAPDGLDAARAIAEANPHFGAGGATELFISAPDVAVANGLLEKIGTHEFDPKTLRSLFEDPAYRFMDPDLPIQALDPEHEKLVGYLEGLREKGLETVRDKAIIAEENSSVVE